MKRRDLVREIERSGCEFLRHGHRHDIYVNPSNGRKSPVPRHSEIPEDLRRKIRKQLGLD